MKRLYAVVLTVMLAFAGFSPGGDSKKEQDALQGNWKVLSVKTSDNTDPPEDFLKEVVVVVKSDEMKLMVKDETVMSFKMKLDSSKQPKAVDFTHLEGAEKGQTELGIYKLEGDKLTICTNDEEKGGRPTAFATKEGTKFQLMVFQKAK